MLSEISQSPKIKGQMFFLISGWWYIIGVGGWEKNGGTLDYVEGNEGRGYEKSCNETDIITLCACMITGMVWIYIMYNHKNEAMNPICVQWIKMKSVKNKKK